MLSFVFLLRKKTIQATPFALRKGWHQKVPISLCEMGTSKASVNYPIFSNRTIP